MVSEKERRGVVSALLVFRYETERRSFFDNVFFKPPVVIEGFALVMQDCAVRVRMLG